METNHSKQDLGRIQTTPGRMPSRAALVLPLVILATACRNDRQVTGVEITWIRSQPAGVSFSKTEITVGQFRACVASGGTCREDTYEKAADLKNCNWGHKDRTRHPMNCVNWHGAIAFCRWAKGRLPTKEEWHAEASNGGTREYPWGDDQATCAHSVMHLGGVGAGCNRSSTWPACSKPAGNSVSGLCDMSGNVWEWTSSAEGRTRVLRGGGWDICTQEYLSSAARVKFSPSFKFVNLGFRCVRSPKMSQEKSVGR